MLIKGYVGSNTTVTLDEDDLELMLLEFEIFEDVWMACNSTSKTISIMDLKYCNLSFPPNSHLNKEKISAEQDILSGLEGTISMLGETVIITMNRIKRSLGEKIQKHNA